MFANILSKKNVTDEQESSQAASRLHEHLLCTSACVSSMSDYQPPPALPHKAGTFLLLNTASTVCPVPISNQLNCWHPCAMPLLDEIFAQQAAASAYNM